MTEERELIIQALPHDPWYVTVAYKRHMPSGDKFGEFVRVRVLDLIRVLPKLYENL